jgi:hypothetical protein
MALVKRPDVNIRDNLNKFGKTCRAEGQVTQDLESIGLGVRGDTELGLSRASFTGLEPDPAFPCARHPAPSPPHPSKTVAAPAAESDER